VDRERVHRLLEKSPRGGILVLDDTGLPKQGKASVGVARQYSGTLGKVGNCQVVVSAEYAADEPASSTPIHWPISATLYLPEKWTEDPELRVRAQLPEEVRFRTKPEIALEMVDRAREWAVPFGFVVADHGYGSNPSFLEGLQGRGVLYVCGVEKGFGLRLAEEVKAAEAAPPPEHRGPGPPPGRRPAPLHRAEEVTRALPEEAWQTVAWREGAKGRLIKQFAAVRANWATGNPASGRSPGHHRIKTGPEGWLLAERPLPGEQGETKFYYSNLPADIPLERLAELAHARWVIEQFYEDAKGECGLGDYQGRGWEGLHRHLALAMLAYSFLVEQRMEAGLREEGASVSPLRGTTKPALPAQKSAGVAAGGPGAVVHRYRPDQVLSTS
jgi:SRSO17 transposase